jgi:general secretion pathway protein C
MSTRWWTFGVWAAVAASAVYWGLKVFVAAPPLPPSTQVAELGAAARGDLSRLLGVDAPAPVLAVEEAPADARFQLIGVVSPRSTQAAREGLALIAVDGKPAKAFRVGAIIDGQTVLQAVGARSAKLGLRDGATQVALNIAPPPPAATGTLPLGAGIGLPNGGGTYSGIPRPVAQQMQQPMLLPPQPGQVQAQRRMMQQSPAPLPNQDLALPPPLPQTPQPDPSNLR